MPVRGGTADKFGNRYETLWAVDQLIRIADRRAVHLNLEPLNPDQSSGVEFVVGAVDGTIEYWSVKRQTTRASGWTLALLAERDDRGRSILGDLLQHVERDPSHRAVFASTLGARDVEELRTHAADTKMLEERLAQSRELKSQFLQYVLPLCNSDPERARAFLLHTIAYAADEPQLRERVDCMIRKLFYPTAGTELDCDAARGHLAELLLDNIHREITRQMILQMLATHSIGFREWANEGPVRNQVESICDAYVATARSEFINGKIVPLEGSEQLLAVGTTPVGKKLLVVAGAGGGKSSILAQ